jgi:hypothetical protein
MLVPCLAYCRSLAVSDNKLQWNYQGQHHGVREMIGEYYGVTETAHSPHGQPLNIRARGF